MADGLALIRTPRTGSIRRHRPILVLVAFTAVWGVTFVQVKDAIAIYPLFAFVAVRFAIASCTLAPLGARRLPMLRAGGLRAGALTGALVAAGYVLVTGGLERTSVSSAGFISGLYVVLTPLIALALFRIQIGVVTWIGIGVATVGLALLSGVRGGPVLGNLLVFAGAAVYSLQIALMERYAPRYDTVAFTFVEMLTALALLAPVAAALGDLRIPHGWTVWGALLVTGVFASALGFLAQTWAQRRASATQTALAFTVEPVWTAFFGFTLAGDRLGVVAWVGALLILAGISLALSNGAMHNSFTVSVTLEPPEVQRPPRVEPDPEALMKEARRRARRRRLAVAGVAIALGAAVVGVVTVLDTGGPQPKQRSSALPPTVAPRCEAAHLRLAPTFYGAAGGQFIQTLTFTNVSARACRMSGWPRVVGVKSQRVVQGPEGARPFRVIALRSHAAASFDVYGADWDNLANRPCPQTTAFDVIPPGSGDRLRVAAKVPNCPGGLEVAPLVAGRSDRQSWSFVWNH